MKNKINYLLVCCLFSVLLLACNKKEKTGSCQANIICYEIAPEELYVRLDFSANQNNAPIEVNFYRGNINTGVLLETFYTTNSKEYYLLPVGDEYSATARYLKNSDTIVVIDGEKLSQKYCSTSDGKDCYDWDYEMVLDLKLK